MERREGEEGVEEGGRGGSGRREGEERVGGGRERREWEEGVGRRERRDGEKGGRERREEKEEGEERGEGGRGRRGRMEGEEGGRGWRERKEGEERGGRGRGRREGKERGSVEGEKGSMRKMYIMLQQLGGRNSKGCFSNTQNARLVTVMGENVLTSLLNECSKGGKSSAWSNHYNRNIPFPWQPEVMISTDKYRNSAGHATSVLKEGGTDSGSWSVQ